MLVWGITGACCFFYGWAIGDTRGRMNLKKELLDHQPPESPSSSPPPPTNDPDETDPLIENHQYIFSVQH